MYRILIQKLEQSSPVPPNCQEWFTDEGEAIAFEKFLEWTETYFKDWTLAEIYEFLQQTKNPWFNYQERLNSQTRDLEGWY